MLTSSYVQNIDDSLKFVFLTNQKVESHKANMTILKSHINIKVICCHSPRAKYLRALTESKTDSKLPKQWCDRAKQSEHLTELSVGIVIRKADRI